MTLFLGKILSTPLLFLILKIVIFEHSYLKKKNISLWKFFLTILATENFTFEIENSRVVENILTKEISYDLWKSNHLKKLVRSDSKEIFFYKKQY